jgi:putative cardiolipin synthase
MLSGKLPLVWAHAQLVYDTPDKKRAEKDGMVGRLMHRPVAKALAAVQTELLMITPYLIPGDEGMQLFADLRKRDARVRILTSSLESSMIVAHSGYIKYRVPLLQMGVELYEVRSLLGDARGSGQTAHISRFGNYKLHAKLFVFDRQRLFIGSMNFDLRSMHLNTEIGLIIDSPELAQQSARRFEAMAQPLNSYAVLLLPQDNGRPPVLAWRTQENGKTVQYDKEPARSNGQRLMLHALSLLPLDAEL